MTTRLVFHGTGASGGTPGATPRLESSMSLEDGGRRLLIDVTRDLDRQQAQRPDAVALTHGHRDASGGIPALAALVQDGPPVPVFASPQTFQVLRGRYARLDHIQPIVVEPGEVREPIEGVGLRACDVPHADRDRFRTYAWRLTTPRGAVVYASDVARPTDELRDLTDGAAVLVIDGAMYQRSIFSHLRIDEDLPTICRWGAERILLTQVGRTAPPHEELRRVVADLCERAEPAHDGMVVEL